MDREAVTRMTTTLDYGIAPPNYRLPATTRIGRVKLQVADLARSIDFYVNVLGLRVVDEAPDHATLAPRLADPAIVELVERKGARTAPRRGLLGLFHFAILLPDRASLGRFLRHLAEIGAQAGMSDHLVSEAIYLHDPDGLGIEVYADRPRETWAHADRQLTMSTEPLNASDLIAAGGDAGWDGMPEGTVIGHVHLHVGDLERAEAFYHRALGFDKIVWSYPGALFLSAGGYHHHLGTNTWARGAASASEADARLLEWEVVLPSATDVQAAAASVAAAGHEVRAVDHDAVIADPWGTTLRLRV
jgi:catechol 2,3-dioxygenase